MHARRIKPLHWHLAALAALFAALLMALPRPARAEGLFDFLFGGISAPIAAGQREFLCRAAGLDRQGRAGVAERNRRCPARQRQYRSRGGVLRAAMRRPAFSARAHDQRDADRDLPGDVPGEQDQGLLRRRNRRRRGQGRPALCAISTTPSSTASKWWRTAPATAKTRSASRRSTCRTIRRCGPATSFRPRIGFVAYGGARGQAARSRRSISAQCRRATQSADRAPVQLSRRIGGAAGRRSRARSCRLSP